MGLEELGMAGLVRAQSKAQPLGSLQGLAAGSSGTGVRTKGSNLPKTLLPVPACVRGRGQALALSTLGWVEASRAP